MPFTAHVAGEQTIEPLTQPSATSAGLDRSAWNNAKTREALRLAGFAVGQGGIEPPTRGFSVLCSTD